MFDAVERLRRKVIPNDQDRMVSELMRDISTFEVSQWLGTVIDQLAYDVIEHEDFSRENSVLPPGTLEAWRTLSPFKQELAFCYLLGAVQRLLRPPDDFVGAEVGF